MINILKEIVSEAAPVQVLAIVGFVLCVMVWAPILRDLFVMCP